MIPSIEKIFITSFHVHKIIVYDSYALHKPESTLYMFCVCLFGVYRPTRKISLIWRRHYYR